MLRGCYLSVALALSALAQMTTASGFPKLYDVLHGGRETGGAMPPSPAAPLDDYELTVLDAWIKNPVCSHAANPDPDVCPADAGR